MKAAEWKKNSDIVIMRRALAQPRTLLFLRLHQNQILRFARDDKLHRQGSFVEANPSSPPW